MTSYGPPSDDVAIFDTIYFKSGEEFLTQNQADKRYLRFPNAQGTENLQEINVNGNATFNANIICSIIEDLYGTLTLDAVGITITSDTEIQGVLNMGAIPLVDRRIDMNGGEIHQVSLVHSQNNNDITIEAKGTGDVILETATIPRLTISDTGFQTFQGGMTYNNATNTLTAATFNGTAVLATAAASIGLTEDNTTNADFFIPFAPTGAGTRALSVDTITGPLTYNPVTSTLTATNFVGTILTSTNSNNVLLTSDNTSGTYYIPFSKTSGTGNKALFQDDTTGPLSYNPSTSTLATNYIDIGNPYLFDDFETFLQSNGPFGWFNGTLTLGATRTLYTGALDATQSLNLPRRFGLLSCATGPNNNSDFVMVTASTIVRPANTKSITFGGVDCGTGTLASIATPSATNVTKSIGLYTTSSPNSDDTNSNSIIWRRSSANTSATAWEFRVNNVLATNGTGPNTADCNYFRVTIEFQLSGGNYQTRGIFTNLGPNNTGSFTSDWVNVPVNPTVGDNSNFIGWHLLNNGDASARVIAMDYCLLQNNSFPINRGTTSALSR